MRKRKSPGTWFDKPARADEGCAGLLEQIEFLCPEDRCSVVAYDIPNDRRRTKIHQLLQGYGKWTQYSLFECFLTRKQLVLLQSKVEKHLDDAKDSVRFYPLCATCVSRVETVGGPPPAEEVLFLV